MHAAIHTRDLRRRFGPIRALAGLDLEVAPGEIVGLLGHNGAGKTTTVRLLSGLLLPSGGEARVLGLDPWRDGPRLRARVGVLTEGAAVDGRLTALETLSFHARVHGLDRPRARAQEALEWLGLADRGAERVGGYSVGMRRRLALARALMNAPELLMLDEPVAALDPVAARSVHGLIREQVRARRASVLVCTHNLVEAERLCDRVVVLERGRVMADGPPRALAATTGRLVITVAPAATADAAALIDGAVEGRDQVVLEGAAREDVPGLVARLADAGVPIFEVAQAAATLEDVYFALHADDPP